MNKEARRGSGKDLGGLERDCLIWRQSKVTRKALGHQRDSQARFGFQAAVCHSYCMFIGHLISVRQGEKGGAFALERWVHTLEVCVLSRCVPWEHGAYKLCPSSGKPSLIAIHSSSLS